jgi:superfamily II DNA or RNA helicase
MQASTTAQMLGPAATLAGTLAIDLRSVAPPFYPLIERLRSDLTLHKAGFGWADPGSTECYFQEHDGWFHVARGYPLTPAGRFYLSPVRVQDQRSGGWALPPGTHTTAVFGVPPFPLGQPSFIQDIVRGTLSNGHGGMALAPTRSGKTLCAIEAACRLGGATLILVDRDILLRQWKSAVDGSPVDPGKAPNPNAPRVVTGAGVPVRCGVIREDSFEYGPGVPFAVATMQTIARRGLPAEFRRAWRTVIVDECQTAPCASIWGALQRIDSSYVLGLTATPDRKDGLGPAIPWLIGPVLASLERKLEADVVFRGVPWRNCAYPDVDTDEATGETTTRMVKCRVKNAQGFNRIAVEKALMNDEQRIAWLVREFAMLREQGRRVLTLVGMREHVGKLAAECKRIGLDPGVFMGGESDTRNMERNPVIATYGIASKGVDFQPAPTALVFGSPAGDVRQARGRALQPQAEMRPLIVDVVDVGHIAFMELAVRRARDYTAAGFRFLNELWTVAA